MTVDFLLINACIEMECGALGGLAGLGVEVLDRPAVAEAEGVAVDTTVEGDNAGGVRTVVGSVALQAARTSAAGSTHSAFTQSVSSPP
jgi:hypothetical protein